MRISFTNYPIDIILCITWAIILPPIALLTMDSTIRTILGLPFILFIPGYTLIFALFPTKKSGGGIGRVERITLSLGFSIAITSLLGLMLNFTPWQIRLEPILFVLFFFIIGVGSIAFYRWMTTPPELRLIVSFDITLPKSNSTLDTALTIILGISLIIAMIAVTYIIVTPKKGEIFTEFYVLDPQRNTTNYPKNILAGENASVIIGLINHEYKQMNYTIEIWLIDETIVFNESTQINETIYNHLWYLDTITVVLPHIDIEKPLPQWESNYSFSINITGEFKLEFLLFTTPPEEYSHETDYRDMMERKIDSAYKEVHLWLTIL